MTTSIEEKKETMDPSSDVRIQKKIDTWKKKLLDLGMRNRLLNFKDSRRGSLTLTAPDYKELFQKLAVEEKTLTLPYYKMEEVYEPETVAEDLSVAEAENLPEDDSKNLPVAEAENLPEDDRENLTLAEREKQSDAEQSEPREVKLVKRSKLVTVSGDVTTDRDGKEAHLTAKNLRDKAKTIQEEQGVNVLYLAFGFLDWKDEAQGKDQIQSPLILVPVVLKQGIITDPYKMHVHEDEIVVNPTLRYKLENDYKFLLPDFDAQNEDLEAYLQKVGDMVNSLGWKVNTKTSLSLLSFTKINMYKDLEVHTRRLQTHPLIQGLCGEASSDVVNQVDFAQMDGFQHDALPAESVFQVVDADSSQQDAILMSQKGASFVLQGPPGTGKSQTITNMIAQALGEGKKVLFVSEKMAALEVVYNRLSSAGLADFCLVLHSNKANKREFLDSLRKVTELKAISVKESALFKLKELEDRRSKLNDYCAQLHQVMEPMHQSVFDANGTIANLADVPDMIFALEDVDLSAMTQDDLYQMRLTVDELGKSKKKLTEDYEVNTWRNTTITQINHEIRHDLSAHFVKTREALDAYQKEAGNQAESLSLSMDLSFSQLEPMADLLDYCTGIPYYVADSSLTNADSASGNDDTIPDGNLPLEKEEKPFLLFLTKDEDTLKRMKDQSTTIESVWKEADGLKQTLSNDYKEGIFNLDGASLLKALLPNQILSAQTAGENQEAEAVGEEDLLAFLSLYSTEIRAEDFWFTPKWRNTEVRKQWFDTCVARVIKVAKARAMVLTDYEKDVLTIDYKGMLARFKTDYTSFFKFLNGQYKQDCNSLRALRKTPVKKLSNEEILQVLNQLKDYHEALEELEANETEFKLYLGGWYQGEWTEFEQISQAYDAFAKLQSLYEGNFPETVKEDLLSGMNTSRYAEDLLYLKSQLSTGDESLLAGQSISTGDGSLFAGKSIEDLRASCGLVLNWEGALSPLKELRRSPSMCHSACYDGLLKLAAYQRFHNTLSEFQPKLQEFYGDLYQGDATDWTRIHTLLDWNIVFQEKAQGVLSARALEALPSEEALEALSVEKLQACMAQPGFQDQFGKTAQWIRDYLKDNGETLSAFCDMYREEVGLAGKPLSTLSDWAERCQNNLEGLEDWLDFMQVLNRCEEMGLKDFTDKALEAQIPENQLTGAFLKRVQRLWLDVVMPELPAVQAFRTRAHEEVIKEFTSLDQEQMKIAQSRIRERLIKNLPNMNSFTSARDEVGILNHEMGKQRKIMPVRKLFNSIPNLLPRLKPCMMMSPLSVSQFLESEAYQFDLVIFDEASQVKTENAIGAISRGKQAIIAGDMHQLPPTNFFNTALAGADDYDGEEEDDSEAFESVLDETGTVMPQLTLKWHYRSKNESLITFSNRKIYNNSLVTFPSPTSSHELEGVEYIYVPEGTYQRSTSRNNPVEAQRVAEEIFELIRIQPKRSMGVITFSEAQQRCVEEAVIAKRLANPDYEWYFSEGKEEPFFIKNLENVQGDERDIILFSIGYGKSTPTEELHMNFGPLNQAGGYRRLNVAITRAKYTIKLIGSILPTDMRITEDSPKGVRMLRDYIAYAQNGVEALEEPGTIHHTEQTEEGFEEAIRTFLKSKGYNLANQVGCSGYRIDMAVKHPSDPERYLLGIECDGAAYHSSRTARERDRLRHSVLRAMGWKFYRVWSTDWVKDPVTEGEHLLAAIEEVLKKEEEAEAMLAAAEEAEAEMNASAEEAEAEALIDAAVEAEAEASIDSAVETQAETLIDAAVETQAETLIDASVETQAETLIDAAVEAENDLVEETTPVSFIDADVYAMFEDGPEEYEEILEETPLERGLPGTETKSRFGFAYFEPKSFPKMTSDYPLSAVADAIDILVEEQAPIHLYLVCKQVAPLMGSSKVTQKVKDQLLTTIKTYQGRHGWELRGDYLWKAGQTEAVPRIPEGEEVYREIKYIAPEELAAAMKVILDQSFGLPKEDLYKVLVKEYGYARTTGAMTEYLNAAYDLVCSLTQE